MSISVKRAIGLAGCTLVLILIHILALISLSIAPNQFDIILALVDVAIVIGWLIASSSLIKPALWIHRKRKTCSAERNGGEASDRLSHDKRNEGAQR